MLLESIIAIMNLNKNRYSLTATMRPTLNSRSLIQLGLFLTPVEHMNYSGWLSP